jgi:hypothetical protein
MLIRDHRDEMAGVDSARGKKFGIDDDGAAVA